MCTLHGVLLVKLGIYPMSSWLVLLLCPVVFVMGSLSATWCTAGFYLAWECLTLVSAMLVTYSRSDLSVHGGYKILCYNGMPSAVLLACLYAVGHDTLDASGSMEDSLMCVTWLKSAQLPVLPDDRRPIHPAP